MLYNVFNVAVQDSAYTVPTVPSPKRAAFMTLSSIGVPLFVFLLYTAFYQRSAALSVKTQMDLLRL